MQIKFSPPDISQVEIDEVVDTLKSGWITTGPKTKLFEKKIAEYCNVSGAVCFNSATAGMELVLRLLGIGEGDEVITSAYTYTASASVINHVGAKIVLIDVDKDSYEMDYSQMEKAITAKTKAIIPVDIAGVICDYDKIYKIIEEKKHLFTPNNDMQKALGRICILADAAHSFGSVKNNKKSGQFADFSSFSFHAVKNLTTAEGGAVVWNNFDNIASEEIYKQLMLLALHGQTKDALSKTKPGMWEYDIVSLAYKYNMTDIMASLGLGQISRYSQILERRKKIVSLYDNAFKNTNIKFIAHSGENFQSNCHLYLTRIEGEECKRNAIIEEMAKQGIATNVHYKPLPMFSGYKKLGFNIKDYPNAYAMFANEITLPLHSLLTDEEVEYIIKNFVECNK